MKVKWNKSGLFCLLMSFVVLTIGADETPSAEENPTEMACEETCGGNQTLFEDCSCGCENGFHKDELEMYCVKDICDPLCEGKGVECRRNECVCQEGYSIKGGEPGAPNCVLNTTTQTEQMLETIPALETIPTLTTNSTNVTSPTTPTTQNPTTTTTTSMPTISTTTTTKATNVTSPATPTAQNPTTTTTTSMPTISTTTTTKATSLTPTSQGTPTIHQNNTTITQETNLTKKHKTQKYVMGAWEITGIIILVACLVGAIGYACYKTRHRGSLRIATSTEL